MYKQNTLCLRKPLINVVNFLSTLQFQKRHYTYKLCNAPQEMQENYEQEQAINKREEKGRGAKQILTHTQTHRVDIQPLFIICRLSICGFTYSLKFICNPKSILTAFSWSLADMCTAVKNLSHPTCHYQLKLNKVKLPPCFSSPSINKCPFLPSIQCIVHILCFLFVISLFKMAHQRSAEGLPFVPKCKKGVMSLREKMHVR